MTNFEKFDALPIGIFVLNRNYEIIFWNHYLEIWTGWKHDELLGTDARVRLPALKHADYQIRLKDTFANGVPSVFSPQLHVPLMPSDNTSGSQRVLATTVTALPDLPCKGFLAVFTIQDISDLTRRLQQVQVTASQLTAELQRRKALELELCRAKQTAEKANQSKTDFLATMSHEIRTPMRAILGMSDLLSESDLSRSQRQYVEIFQRAVRNLLTLINDILHLTKIESGCFDIEGIEFDLAQVIQESVNLIRPAAAAKELEFEIRLGPGLQMRLIGDPTRIHQILVNVLGNAVKFTGTGKIELYVGPHGAAGSGNLEIAVSDTSVGIPRDKLDLIFDDFLQGDPSNIRKYGGTGLGLSFARRLVEKMGGKFSVSSEVGKGTTFSFSLQTVVTPGTFGDAIQGVPADPTPTLEPAGAACPRRLRILVTEDSEDNQILIKTCLNGTEQQPSFVGNGLEAVQSFSSECDDMVFMDVQMPVMDGLRATREIRRIERANHLSAIPIIAITASALSHDREATAQAGCDEHLTKPISRNSLNACSKAMCEEPERVADEPVQPNVIEVSAPPGLEALVGPYLENRRKDLERFNRWLGQGDFEEIRRLGHQIKGTGGGYGFPVLTAVGEAIEDAATRRRVPDIQAQLRRLDDYLSRVRIA